MKIHALKFLAIAVAGSALLASLPAEAGRDRYEYRERIDYRDHGKKHRKHKNERVVIRERTIVHRPIVREYHYYEAPAPYYYSRDYYSRDPSVVIGVSIPPLIIPLR